MKRQLMLATILASVSVFAAAGWDSVSPPDAQSDPTTANAPHGAPAQAGLADAQSSRDPNAGFNLAQGLAAGASPVKSALNGTSNYAAGALQSFGHQYLPTFELGFSLAARNKSVYGILGVVPLFESKDLSNTVFGQFSSYLTDGRTTVNLGLGDRYLLADERLLLGVNFFYDYEFPYSHARTSIGTEIRTSMAELNANFYQAQSGWRTGKNGLAEKAMGGMDVEIGFALPYLPQFKAFGRHFQWNATDGAANLNGNEFSLRASLMQGVSVEAARTYYAGNTQPNANVISLQLDIIRLLNRTTESKPFFANQAYTLESMREHRFDKVRRENIIQKQVGRGFIVTASGR